ncbi:MAG: site-specific integrase [Propionicimonas sp.]
MAGKNIAARPASWRVLYLGSSGRNRVSTVSSQAEADALVAELAGQGVPAKAKATAAAWRARFVDDAGKEHAKHFARKRDVQTWLDAQTTATVTGTYVVPNAGKVTFREYAESWRTSQVFRPSTAALVELALRKRVYPVIGTKALSAISKTTIQTLVASLNETYAPATVVVTYSYVSTVLKDAVENRRIARTPCVGIKLPQIVKKRVEPRTTDQVQAAATAAGDRLRAAVLLAAGTGMRRGEVFGLTADRVRFLERKIIVDRQLVGVRTGSPVFGPPKTASSVREIPLPTSVAEALAEHIEQHPPGPAGLLFTTSHGHAWRWTTLGDVWRARMTAAKLDGFDFHELRHYYASLLIRYGESVKTVQARLGHKSAEETLNTYSHLWPDSDDRSRDAVDAALRAESGGNCGNFPDSLRTPSHPGHHLA